MIEDKKKSGKWRGAERSGEGRVLFTQSRKLLLFRRRLHQHRCVVAKDACEDLSDVKVCASRCLQRGRSTMTTVMGKRIQ